MTSPERNEKSNVASLAEARKRAAEKAKAERIAANVAGGPRSLRDWVIGGTIIALALAYVMQLVLGLDATPAVSGGAR